MSTLISKRDAKFIGQLVETKYGYFINGQYHKKNSFSPVPLKFGDIESNKNIFITNRIFPITRIPGVAYTPNELNSFIHDENNPDIYYILTPQPGNVGSDGIYQSENVGINLYKVFETENEFRILGKRRLFSSEASDHHGIPRYLFQDNNWIYMSDSYIYSSYNEENVIYCIDKKDFNNTVFPFKSYPSSLKQLLYEDDDCAIFAGYYSASSAINFTSYRITALLKNMEGASKSSPYNTVTYTTAIKDPEDDSQYTFFNNGTPSDDPSGVSKANYKTFYSTFRTPSQLEIHKKFNGIFTDPNTNHLQTYRIFIGSDNNKEDGLLNICRFDYDIEAIKGGIGSSLPDTYGKTCEITNKESEEFKEWRTITKNISSGYLNMHCMKFSNGTDTFLVFNIRLSKILCYKGNGSATYTPYQSIVTFKINQEDTSKLTFIGCYDGDGYTHMDLTPLDDEYQILSTIRGWRVLKFNYETGLFEKIAFYEASTGWFGMDSDGRLYGHVNGGDLEEFKARDYPFRPKVYFETPNMSMDGQESITTNVVVENKDFLGNNINSKVTVYLEGENIKFTDNDQKTIEVTLTSSDDNVKVGVTITGPGHFDVSCAAEEEV